MKTQKQMYYDAVKKSAVLNEAFLDAVKDSLTKNELQKLIEKRPEVYERFANWLIKLP